MCHSCKRLRGVSREELLSPPAPRPTTAAAFPTDTEPVARNKRCKTESPTSVERVEVSKASEKAVKNSTTAHRDEMVAALLTITSALGLARETLHLCASLVDRYLALRSVESTRLEALSIACLWIAVKFVETPTTISGKRIKQILQRRRHSSNWTWNEVLALELHVLQALKFRVMATTVLDLVQKKLHAVQTQQLEVPQEQQQQDAHAFTLTSEKRQLALYFADLLLLKARANQFSPELQLAAIWFVVSGHQITSVEPPLLAPVVLLFLAHRDNINPQHAVFKPWFALRCRYGASLVSPWQVPYDSACGCRVCENAQAELAA